MSKRLAAAVAAAMVIGFCGTGGGSAAADPAPVQPAPVQLSQARSAAAATVPAASNFISGLADRAIDDVTNPALSDQEKIQRFRQLLATSFDVPYVARFVLGRYWRQATPEERDEYTKLFEDFVVKVYADRFHQYGGQKLQVGAAMRQDDDVMVNSNVVDDGKPPVRVDWKLRPDGETFKIVDVIVEGVSMAVTQRDDFAATIQAKGGKVAGLIEALRQKVQTASN